MSRPILHCIVLSLTAAAGVASAQDGITEIEHAETHGPHEHVPTTVDPTLGWDELIEQTVRNYPSYVELLARDAEARAWRDRSRKLLAGQPSLAVGFASDRWFDDTGFDEYAPGVDLPLWRGGQRRAARELGDSVTDEAGAARAALRWEVAGLLREALWQIADAGNAVALGEDALVAAEEVKRVVMRRYETGELALDDTLLASTAVLERRSALLELRAELVDAERAYSALTGLTRRPADFAETRSVRDDFDDTHPLLAMKTQEVERARSELEFAERSAGGNPSLHIGTRRQRDALGTFYFDAVDFAFSMPFGGKAHTATATTAAARRVAEAESTVAALLRTLDATLHEAEHTLSVTEDALLIANERADISNRHWEMGQKAFEEGEITLVDLLRREESARIATLDVERLTIVHGRTIAEINQAIGELP